MRCSFLFPILFVGISCIILVLGFISLVSFDIIWVFYWENVLYIIVATIFIAACVSRSKISSIRERWRSFLFACIVIFFIVFAWDQSKDSEQIQDYLQRIQDEQSLHSSILSSFLIREEAVNVETNIEPSEPSFSRNILDGDVQKQVQFFSVPNTIVQNIDSNSGTLILYLFYLFVTFCIASCILIANLSSLKFVTIAMLLQWSYLVFLFMSYFTKNRTFFFSALLLVLFVYIVLIRVNMHMCKRVRVI